MLLWQARLIVAAWCITENADIRRYSGGRLSSSVGARRCCQMESNSSDTNEATAARIGSDEGNQSLVLSCRPYGADC